MNNEISEKRQYTMKDGEITKRLLVYTKPYIFQFIVVFILMFITVALALVGPYLIGLSIDVINTSNVDLNELFTILSIFGISIVLGSVVNYAQTIMLQIIGQSIIYNIREEVFTHLEYQDINYLNSTPTGAFVTRVTNDTNTLNEMYTSVIVNVIKNVLMVIGIVVVMFLINVQLTLYVLIVIPFIILFAFIFRRYSRKAYREVRANLSNI